MTQLSLRQRVAPPVRLLKSRTGERAARPELMPLPSGLAFTQAVLALIALLVIAFIVEVAVVGSVRHARAQSLAYDQFRTSLANGTVPVGQVDGSGSLMAVGTPIAYLQINSIGVNDVVFQGTTSEVLADGPGHRRDTPFPGQVGTSVLYGRQSAYGGDFGDLSSLKPGDPITVTTGQGVEHFVVSDLRHAGDRAAATYSNTAVLTLVTTDGLPFLPQRLLYVDAHMIGTPLPTPGMAYGSDAVGHSENAMSGDDSDAIQLVLWSELLLLVAAVLVWVRSRWGRWQTWVVAVPVLGLASMQTAHYLAMNLPNLM